MLLILQFTLVKSEPERQDDFLNKDCYPMALQKYAAATAAAKSAAALLARQVAGTAGSMASMVADQPMVTNPSVSGEQPAPRTSRFTKKRRAALPLSPIDQFDGGDDHLNEVDSDPKGDNGSDGDPATAATAQCQQQQQQQLHQWLICYKESS